MLSIMVKLISKVYSVLVKSINYMYVYLLDQCPPHSTVACPDNLSEELIRVTLPEFKNAIPEPKSNVSIPTDRRPKKIKKSITTAESLKRLYFKKKLELTNFQLKSAKIQHRATMNLKKEKLQFYKKKISNAYKIYLDIKVINFVLVM